MTSDAFPSPEAVVRFIRACLDAGVPFKATAGLHHPLRAEYRLTYAADSPCGTMFGFLNLFLATVFMADGLDEPQAEELLEERDPGSIQMEESGISWRGRRVAVDTVSRARETGIVSFGSCSFTEPVGDLRTLGLRVIHGSHSQSRPEVVGRVRQRRRRLSDSKPAVRRIPPPG